MYSLLQISAGNDAFTTATAESNIFAPITKRSAGDRAIICSRTSRLVSSVVSVMQTLLKQIIQSQLVCPTFYVLAIVASGEQVLHVAQLNL